MSKTIVHIENRPGNVNGSDDMAGVYRFVSVVVLCFF